MSTHRVRHHPARVAVALAALLVLGACANDSDDPVPSPSPSPDAGSGTPTVTAAEVRATLGTVDPCSLLDGGAPRAPYAQGPHTCDAQLDDVRVRVEVGIPLDDESTADAERGEVAGLVAFTTTDGCSTVFPVDPAHGISVSVDDRCEILPRAADLVGAALAAPDIDASGRPPGPDAHTACGLMSAAATDPALLVDGAGDGPQGLDHCELASGPVLARSGLSIDYTSTPFTKMARLVTGDRVELAGRDAVVSRGETGCFVHTYLWETDAEGRGTVHAEAVARAADCREARALASVVIEGAAGEPAAPGSVADLIASSQR